MRREPRVDVTTVKAMVSLHDLVARYVKLQMGERGSWWGCCPFHDERTASFHVLEARGVFHCFGCGAGGDAIAFLMKIEGIDFIAALHQLAGGREPDPAQIARMQERRRRQERFEQERQRLALATVLAVWRTGRALAAGSLTARYLEGRGLPGPWPETLRSAPPARQKGWPSGIRLPSLMAAITRWPGRALVGVQRTALVEPGRKADVDPVKWTYGPARGGAVRLAPWQPGRQIVLVEGVEDGLSVLAVAPETVPWAVLGAEKAEHVVLPEAAEVILAFDSDVAGRRATEATKRVLLDRGHVVRLAELPGHDPNAVLCEASA